MKDTILSIFLGASALFPASAQLKPAAGINLDERLAAYKTIKLEADLSGLQPNEKRALKYLIQAAQYADTIYWRQTYGNPYSLINQIKDEKLKKYVWINYGPWDRMNNNQPFIEGVGAKPKGVNFYPKDMRVGEFDSFGILSKKEPYTILHRGPMPQGDLPAPILPTMQEMNMDVLPYNMVYQFYINRISENMIRATEALGPAYDKEFFTYLRDRAEGLMNNNYNQSDIEWLKVKNSNLDIIIGPIENYEDELFGIKTAYESFVLIRDKKWGEKLEKFIKMLPDLQKNLPVDSLYKTEKAGTGQSQLAVFDAVYYAGDANAGSKTIAVNLPNDETIQKDNGTRRSQLKNVMKAKFDNILIPIADRVIDPAQRANITWDGFFNNVMFHEVAHGLGIKNTVNKKGTVREALGANYSAIEECKADVLGLWMVTRMVDKKELKGKLDDFYITFVASVFRSVRFGAANSHGKANMITFNTLLASGAILRNAKGFYKVDVKKMRASIEKLAGDLLRLQGNGDAAVVQNFLDKMAIVSPKLNADLDKINKAGVPKDLIFEQGLSTLGLGE
jgi:hypothetical protein